MDGIAQYDAVEGAEVEILTEGVVEIGKTTALPIDVGDRLFWDATNKVVNKTATAGPDLVTGEPTAVEWLKMATLRPWNVHPNGVTFRNDAKAFTYDKTDDSLIFMVELTDFGGYVLKWREDLDLVWATALPRMINYDSNSFAQARIERDRWTLIRTNDIYQVDTATGARNRRCGAQPDGLAHARRCWSTA